MKAYALEGFDQERVNDSVQCSREGPGVRELSKVFGFDSEEVTSDLGKGSLGGSRI